MRYGLAVAVALTAFAAYAVAATRAHDRGSEMVAFGVFAGGALALGAVTAGTWHLLGVFGA